MIREAYKKDFNAIVDLWQEMMDLHIELSDLYQMKSNAREIYSNYLKEFLINPNFITLVFESENKIIGYLRAMESSDPRVYEEDVGLILEICVKEKHRNKGIGEKLLSEIEKHFKSKGIERMECIISDFNEVSKSFWQKHGYEPYNLMCVKLLR